MEPGTDQGTARRISERRIGRSRKQSGSSRRRLHYRAVYFGDHVRRRCAVLPGFDTDDQILWRRNDRDPAAGDQQIDLRYGAGRSSRRVYFIHRCRSGCRGRNDLLGAQPADDLERAKIGPRRSFWQLTHRGIESRTYRSGPLDEVGRDRRDRTDRCDHAVSAAWT